MTGQQISHFIGGLIGSSIALAAGYYSGANDGLSTSTQIENAANVYQHNDSIVKSHLSATTYDQFNKTLSEMTRSGKAQELQRVADSFELKGGLKLQAMERELLKKDSLLALKNDTIGALKSAIKALK